MKGKVVVTDNQLPVGGLHRQRNEVPSGTEVTFDGSPSHDPDGAIYAYAWDLDGNGRAGSGADGGEALGRVHQHRHDAAQRDRAPDRHRQPATTSAPESATKSMVIAVQPASSGRRPRRRWHPPLADSTAPVVKLTLAKKLTVKKALKVSFTTNESTSVAATLKVARKTAKARKDFGVAGRHTLTIKLSKSLRRLLRHRRTATLTLAATDDAGNGTTLKRTLKLRAR